MFHDVTPHHKLINVLVQSACNFKAPLCFTNGLVQSGIRSPPHSSTHTNTHTHKLDSLHFPCSDAYIHSIHQKAYKTVIHAVKHCTDVRISKIQPVLLAEREKQQVGTSPNKNARSYHMMNCHTHHSWRLFTHFLCVLLLQGDTI